MFALQPCQCWRSIAWGAVFSVVNLAGTMFVHSRAYKMVCHAALGGYACVSLHLLGDAAKAAVRDAGNWIAALAAIAFVYEAARMVSDAYVDRQTRLLAVAGAMTCFGAAISAHPAGFCCAFVFAVLGAYDWSDRLERGRAPASGALLAISTFGMVALHLGCVTVAICSEDAPPLVAFAATLALWLTARLQPEIARAAARLPPRSCAPRARPRSPPLSSFSRLRARRRGSTRHSSSWAWDSRCSR